MKEMLKGLEEFGLRPKLERAIKLERAAKVLEALGHPERRMKVILVAGTNGKGSVTSYIASILKEAGYKTGSYFSPHLIDYNERFQINGRKISDAKLRNYEKKLLALHAEGVAMTHFEALTGIAYQYFADEGCDYAVMEIGMGGRMDATNVADECISIITNVDLDHTKYLGDTVEKVAFEKAGVIKKGTAITGATGTALREIKQLAAERRIKLRALKEDFFAKPKKVSAAGNEFAYLGHEFLEGLQTTLIGRHQIDNAALAVAAAEELGIEPEAIRKGLLNAKNPGRLDVRGKQPLLVFDAAHNPHGIKELIANLNLFDYDKLVCIFGVMRDKDWKTMLSLLGLHCDLLIATEIEYERAEKAENLAKEAAKYCKAIAEPNVKKAFVFAKKKAKKNDLVLVCGSIYMLGEMLRTK